MFLPYIFYFSGAMVALLLVAKSLEKRREKPFFILRAISRGDTRVRTLSHEVAHRYSECKERSIFFLEKQLPMHSRSFLNKSQAYMREQTDRFADWARNSRLLKRSDGISEFFKSISQVEKGAGEIVDPAYREGFQEGNKEVE